MGCSLFLADCFLGCCRGLLVGLEPRPQRQATSRRRARASTRNRMCALPALVCALCLRTDANYASVRGAAVMWVMRTRSANNRARAPRSHPEICLSARRDRIRWGLVELFSFKTISGREEGPIIRICASPSVLSCPCVSIIILELINYAVQHTLRKLCRSA